MNGRTPTGRAGSRPPEDLREVDLVHDLPAAPHRDPVGEAQADQLAVPAVPDLDELLLVTNRAAPPGGQGIFPVYQ